MFDASIMRYAIWIFNGIEGKHDIYRGENCMKKVLRILTRVRNKDN